MITSFVILDFWLFSLFRQMYKFFWFLVVFVAGYYIVWCVNWPSHIVCDFFCMCVLCACILFFIFCPCLFVWYKTKMCSATHNQMEHILLLVSIQKQRKWSQYIKLINHIHRYRLTSPTDRIPICFYIRCVN